MENNSNKIGCSISLEGAGIIVWIVFMIFDYGCNAEWLTTANDAVALGSHFWTWFPLWAPLALDLALMILLLPLIIMYVKNEL